MHEGEKRNHPIHIVRLNHGPRCVEKMEVLCDMSGGR
jgi:hypothetical protein